MFTDRQKQLILQVLSQLNFKVGESSVAREYEEIAQKLQMTEKPSVDPKPKE